MINNKSFIVPVSITPDTYDSKETVNMFFKSGKEISVKEYKKNHGYRKNASIKFLKKYLTVEDIYNNLITGHLICHIFNPKKTQGGRSVDYGVYDKTDRDSKKHPLGIYLAGKTNQNFEEAWGIFIDIDHTDYPTIESWLERIPQEYLPTFLYSTFSNQSGTPRFRLAYFFDSELTGGNIYRYRYIAWSIGQYIRNWTGEGFEKDKIRITDDGKTVKDSALDIASLKAVQYMNGSNYNDPNFFGIFTGNIFNVKDFNINEESYNTFIQLGAYLSSVSKYKMWKEMGVGILEKNIKELKECAPLTEIQERALDDVENNKIIENIPPEILDDSVIKISDDTRNIINSLGLRKWFDMMYASQEYPIINKTVYNENDWIDGKYIIIGPEYIKIPDNPNYRINDGEHRRKKLYIRAVLRKLMLDNITADILLYNYLADVYSGVFVEVDQVITVSSVFRQIENIMITPNDTLRKDYDDLIKKTQEHTNPKEGIIYKEWSSTGLHNTIRHNSHMDMIDKYYDWKKSAKENMEELNKVLPFSVGKDMLTSYRKEKAREFEQMLYDAIDISKSVNQNKRDLRESGWSFTDETINRLYKEKYNNTV